MANVCMCDQSLNINNNQEANKNHNEILPHFTMNSHYQKENSYTLTRIWKTTLVNSWCGCKFTMLLQKTTWAFLKKYSPATCVFKFHY